MDRAFIFHFLPFRPWAYWPHKLSSSYRMTTTDILIFGSRMWQIQSAKLGSDYMSHNMIRETGKTSIHCQGGHAEQRDRSQS